MSLCYQVNIYREEDQKLLFFYTRHTCRRMKKKHLLVTIAEKKYIQLDDVIIIRVHLTMHAHVKKG
jgi:D-arabinose 5-phosphate isomerase GutQ